jgi:chromosome segregation ATPase
MGKKFDAGYDAGFVDAIDQFNALEPEYLALLQEHFELQRERDALQQRHEEFVDSSSVAAESATETTLLTELHRALARSESFRLDRDRYKTRVENQRAELARRNGLVADPEAPVREKLRRQIEDRENLERLLGEKSRRIAEMEEQIEELDTDVSDLEAAIEAERRDREKERADARQRIAELERLNESQGVTIDTYCNRIEELEADLEQCRRDFYESEMRWREQEAHRGVVDEIAAELDDSGEPAKPSFEENVQSAWGAFSDALNRSFR